MNELLDKFDLIIKYKLNFNQVFYLYLLANNRIVTLYNYQVECPNPLTKKEVNHLYQLGYISEEWLDEYPDNPVITKKGLKVLSNILGDKKIQNVELKKRLWIELYNAYPKYFGVQKFQATGLKAIATLDGKTIEGAPAYASLYFDLIKGDEELHKEIIRKIEWAKEQNAPDNTVNVVPQIHSTLASFIVHQKWNEIEIKQERHKKLY